MALECSSGAEGASGVTAIKSINSWFDALSEVKGDEGRSGVLKIQVLARCFHHFTPCPTFGYVFSIFQQSDYP